jgi:RNA polymerase sigma-70 factor (ECF subfamily)
LLFRNRKLPSIETVYAEYGERIYRFCYRLCGQAAEAEDLAQDVFVAAFQGLEGFEGRSSLSTWLYRIAFYRWRQLHPRGRLPALSLEEDVERMPVQPDLAHESLQRLGLEEALATLPVDLRDAFLLVKAEGLTYREAAEVLEAPQGTIQYRVHEAVQRLRVALGDEPVQTCGSEKAMKGLVKDGV